MRILSSGIVRARDDSCNNAAERRDALFPAEPLQHDPNLFFGREPSAGVRRISRTTFSVDPAFAMGGLLPWQESVSYFTTLRGPRWVDATHS